MNVNAERLEALINSSMNELGHHGVMQEKYLVGVIGDVEIHLTVTRDPSETFGDEDHDCPSICFHNLDIGED